MPVFSVRRKKKGFLTIRRRSRNLVFYRQTSDIATRGQGGVSAASAPAPDELPRECRSVVTSLRDRECHAHVVEAGA